MRLALLLLRLIQSNYFVIVAVEHRSASKTHQHHPAYSGNDQHGEEDCDVVVVAVESLDYVAVADIGIVVVIMEVVAECSEFLLRLHSTLPRCSFWCQAVSSQIFCICRRGRFSTV